MEARKREQILKLLEADSRTTVREIAVMLGLCEDEVQDEIAQLEKERIICGYHAFVNWDKTEDDNISALIELKVTLQRGEGFDRIAEKIYQYPEVEALYLMSGGYDFSVMLKKASMKQIATFVSTKLAAIDEVQSTTTHIILARYKDHGLPLVELKKDQRQAITL